MKWKAGALESVFRPAILDDDASFLELLLVRPDLIGDDVVIVADGRGWGGTGTGWPLAVGWRRTGGPVILGVTTGAATEALLVEPIQLAGATAFWSLAEWDDAVRSWWGAAAAELRERVGGRWGLASEPWNLAAWTRAAWDLAPVSGRAAFGIVATRLSEPIQSAVEWLAASEEAAAYQIRWYGEEAGTVPRLEPVAGGWRADPSVPMRKAAPAPDRESPPARGRQAEEPPAASRDAPARLVTEILNIAREIGCATSESSGWIRIAGGRHSLRVFPGPEWVDLQFVGLDEGTLVGLRYRYGVPLSHEPPPGAPPGAHLRVHGAELGGPLEAMIRWWLELPPEVQAATPKAGRKAAGEKPRKPRNPRRGRPPS